MGTGLRPRCSQTKTFYKTLAVVCERTGPNSLSNTGRIQRVAQILRWAAQKFFMGSVASCGRYKEQDQTLQTDLLSPPPHKTPDNGGLSKIHPISPLNLSPLSGAGRRPRGRNSILTLVVTQAETGFPYRVCSQF